MSHRREQVASTILRALQQVLSAAGPGLADPRADGAMITVTDVSISPDLKQAGVRVSVLPNTKEKLVMHALKHAAAHLRRQCGDLVEIKQMPTLTFELDKTLRQHAEVLGAFAKVAEERIRKGESPSPANTPEAQDERDTDDAGAYNPGPESAPPADHPSQEPRP